MGKADGEGGNTIEGLFSSDLHFLWGYVDVGDRWNKTLFGRLYFIISFWCMFPFSPWFCKRPEYNYSKTKLDNSFLKQNFVKILTTHLDHNLKDASYFVRVFSKSFKKSFLKQVCNDVYDFLSSKANSFPNQQW